MKHSTHLSSLSLRFPYDIAAYNQKLGFRGSRCLQSLIHSHSALHLIHAGLITSKFSLRHKKTALACAYIPERCAVCIAAGYGICARMRLSATTASDPERPQWCMEACIQIPGHTVQYGPCLPQDRRIHHVSECIAHAPMRLSGSMQLNTTLMQ